MLFVSSGFWSLSDVGFYEDSGDIDFRTKISMKLYRDDCSSALCRLDGWTCVFARIISAEPLEVEDGTGRLLLNRIAEDISIEDVHSNDYCYLLLDTTVRPIRCIRITVVPVEIAPLAHYQLKLVRDLEEKQFSLPL